MTNPNAQRLAEIQARIESVRINMVISGAKVTPRALSDILLAEMLDRPDIQADFLGTLVGIAAILNQYVVDGAFPDCFVLPDAPSL